MKTIKKRPNTNSAKIRNEIQKHIIERINTEDYEEHDGELKTSLQIIADEFRRVAIYPHNLKKLGSYQECFIDWLLGLPVVLDLPFMTYEILEFMESIGLPQREKETDQESEYLYRRLIYRELKRLMQQNNITFPA